MAAANNPAFTPSTTPVDDPLTSDKRGVCLPYAQCLETVLNLPLPGIVRMSCFVKGCQMPAHNSQHQATGKRLTGRRLISPEGGNRGMRQGGQYWRSCYGNLSVNLPVQIGKAACHQAADDLCRFGCIRMAPVSAATKRVKMHIGMPSAEWKRDRYRAVVAGPFNGRLAMARLMVGHR